MIASGKKTARSDGRRPAVEAGSFFVAAIVLSSSLWPIGFNLGAYGAVFYEHLFRIWASSIAALIAGLLIGAARVLMGAI